MTYLMRTVALALVYCLALASFHPADVVAGLVLGAAVTVLLRRFLLPGRSGFATVVGRIPAVVVMAALTAQAVVVGSWRVALVVLGIRSIGRPGLVEIPFDGRSERGVAVTGIVVGLPPGDVFVDVDWAREVMIVHVFDSDHADEVVERYRSFYERWQKRVAP